MMRVCTHCDKSLHAVASRLFLLVLGWTLGLRSTAELLAAVLALLAYSDTQCQFEILLA